jgi:hypothetical protein
MLGSHHEVTIHVVLRKSAPSLPRMGRKDFNSVQTVTQVSHALKVNLGFHRLVSLLPVLLLLLAASII